MKKEEIFLAVRKTVRKLESFSKWTDLLLDLVKDHRTTVLVGLALFIAFLMMDMKLLSLVILGITAIMIIIERTTKDMDLDSKVKEIKENRAQEKKENELKKAQEQKEKLEAKIKESDLSETKTDKQ